MVVMIMDGNNKEKVRRHITISKKVNVEMKRLSEINNVSHSYIVETALRYYIENEVDEYLELYEVLNKLANTIHEELKIIRFSANDIKKDLVIVREFINHFFVTQNNERLVTTDEVKSKELEALEELVNDELKKKRQRKLSS